MLTRFKARHPLWGRPLEQCVHDYQVGAASRSKNDETSRLVARAAIEQISLSSTQNDKRGTRDLAELITISTLKAVLKMAEDEDSYQVFLSPGLIGGSISLIQSIGKSGKISPLSYEYGYLCLRVILFALGAYLLRRSQNLELAKKNMIESCEIELPLVFSSHVSRAVIGLVRLQAKTWSKKHCQIPGWGTVDSELALVSPDQIEALVDILWKDRVNLLRAMMTTYVPALPGLMFMFCRFLRVNPSLAKQRTQNVSILQKVVEIHYLCLFVGTKEQSSALDMTMYELAGIFDKDELYANRKFTKVDILDARTIYDAYIKRLHFPDSRLYSPMDVTSSTLFLELLVANIDPGLEELLPPVLRVTVEVLWNALILEKNLDLLIPGVLLVCTHTETLLKPKMKVKDDHPVQERILASLAKSDLVSLIGRILLRLVPMTEAERPEHFSHHQVIKYIEILFNGVKEGYCEHLLEEIFQICISDLFKLRQHLTILEICLESDNESSTQKRREYYRQCRDTWDKITKILVQTENIRASEESWRWCQFPRCPDPDGLYDKGASYVCSGCMELAYCSARCQTSDWRLGEEESHRRTCKEYAELHNPNPGSPSMANALARVVRMCI